VPAPGRQPGAVQAIDTLSSDPGRALPRIRDILEGTRKGETSMTPPPAHAEHTLLVADIGGTFARFALARGGALLGEPTHVARAAFVDLAAACADFLAAQAVHRHGIAIDGAVVAAAGRVHADRIEMTNADWSIDARALEAALGLAHGTVTVLNDFGALAWALPSLGVADLAPIGRAGHVSPSSLPEGTRVIVGPGTGLGVAAAIRTATGWLPLATEGGHATFAPETELEHTAAALAAARHGRVSWERVVSGPGLELLHDAARIQLALPAAPLNAAGIVAAMARGDDPAATLAVDGFVPLIGAFAGDLALLFNAAGGVVIAGGVLPRIAAVRPIDTLRMRFEDKGRFAGWLQGVPTSLLTAPFAALRGAAMAYPR
jgi:glucokinase